MSASKLRGVIAATATPVFADYSPDTRRLVPHLRGLLETGPERLLEVADRYLRPERGAVLGWSLPRE